MKLSPLYIILKTNSDFFRSCIVVSYLFDIQWNARVCIIELKLENISSAILRFFQPINRFQYQFYFGSATAALIF